MGTRGFSVYRYRGRYFIAYSSIDSYPSALGWEMASDVPQDPKNYEKWLSGIRNYLDEQLSRKASHDLEISNWPPLNDLFIEWIYELDLDHEVFLVNNCPFFNLKNMPRGFKAFTKSIGKDSYGHAGYSPSTPEKYRLTSWGIPAPTISQAIIDQYESHNVRQKNSSTEEIFADHVVGGCLEETRIRLLEVSVMAAIKSYQHGQLLRRLESIPNYKEIPIPLADLGRFLLNCAVKPGMIGEQFQRNTTNSDVIWITPMVCVRLATHLTDSSVLQAAVTDILDFVADRRGSTGLIYGIVFSFLHCVIVRIDLKTWTVDHTLALPFLPSFYDSMPSTSGITAIAHLGCLLDPLLDLDVTKPEENGPTRDLPCEIWLQIAEHLVSVNDLKGMGSISSHSWSAANNYLKYPCVGSYRLINLRKEPTLDMSSKAASHLSGARFDARSDSEVRTLYLSGKRKGSFNVHGRRYSLEYLIRVPSKRVLFVGKPGEEGYDSEYYWD